MSRFGRTLLVLSVLISLVGGWPASAAGPTGAIFTTAPDGSVVNENVHYDDKREVYLDGGPPINAPPTAAGLDDGLYVFQVTEPSGKFLLSEDPTKCRIVKVVGGLIVGLEMPSALTPPLPDAWGNKNNPKPCHIPDDPPHPTNPGVMGTSGQHDTNVDSDHGSLGAQVVQIMPYGTTPNPGGVYKAWITRLETYVGKGGNLSAQPSKLPPGQQKPHRCPDFCAAPDAGFDHASGGIKTDNFKVRMAGPPPPPQAMLHVRKFNDRNNNGTPEPVTEPLITGWGISITDPLLVTNLFATPVDIVAEPPGNYVVDEDNPAGWVQTATFLNGVFQGVVDPITVAVAAGSDHTVLFGNFRPSQIRACKFYDFDPDGTQVGPLEVNLAGWPITLTGTTFENVPVGPVEQRTGDDGCTSFGNLIEGSYTVAEGTPLEANWRHTTPRSLSVELAPGRSETVAFGNVCVVPFQGGLTMGYWKTHTGLDSPERDPTYDVLNGDGFIMLGISPEDGYPEQQIDDEAEARVVLEAAESSTDDGILMLKAQLLAAKLNALKFPGFDLAEFPDGTVVGDVIAQADQILDDEAHGINHDKAEIVAVKDLLDRANNNTNTPLLSGPNPQPCPYSFL